MKQLQSFKMITVKHQIMEMQMKTALKARV